MRFHAVTLAVRDPPRLVRFYRDVLGLAPAGENGVQVGETRLAFQAGGGPPHHVAFNIPEDRLAEAKAWLRGRGVALTMHGGSDEVDYPAWNAHACYFEDPEGHVLECIARHSLANASYAPFGPRSLLNVSEVGVVVDDVATAVRRLRDALGVPAFQVPAEHFAPLGDDHGLLIVVSRGRRWFPTGQPAEGAPIVIQAEGVEKEIEPVPGLRFSSG